MYMILHFKASKLLAFFKTAVFYFAVDNVLDVFVQSLTGWPMATDRVRIYKITFQTQNETAAADEPQLCRKKRRAL